MKKLIGGGTGEIYVLLLSLKTYEEAMIFPVFRIRIFDESRSGSRLLLTPELIRSRPSLWQRKTQEKPPAQQRTLQTWNFFISSFSRGQFWPAWIRIRTHSLSNFGVPKPIRIRKVWIFSYYDQVQILNFIRILIQSLAGRLNVVTFELKSISFLF